MKMQNDLISRSDLLKEFDPNGELLDPMAVRMKIVTAPTAYDVEKVVEQLKENSKIYCEEYHQREGSLYIQDVVEIVRNGGKE